MAVPTGILRTDGEQLTSAWLDQEFDRLGYPDSYAPSNAELIQLLWIRPDMWTVCLNAGLPAGGDMATIKAWLISEGWATSLAAPAADRLPAGTTLD